jgi:hypothetical protein
LKWNPPLKTIFHPIPRWWQRSVLSHMSATCLEAERNNKSEYKPNFW